MTDKLYTLIFNTINTQTGLILTKYPDDEDLINDWYADLLIDLDEEALKAFNIYLNKMLAFLEVKEDYERCGVLLKIKKKLK
jgi:hypothetical protein